MGSRSLGYGVVLAILVIATFILSVIAWARSRSRPSFSPAPTPSVSRQPLPSAAADLAEPLTRILSTVVKFPETGNPVLDAITGEWRASARGWRRRRSMPQKPGAHSLQIAGTFSPASRPGRPRVYVYACRVGGRPPLAPPGWGLLGRTTWTEANSAQSI